MGDVIRASAATEEIVKNDGMSEVDIHEVIPDRPVSMKAKKEE